METILDHLETKSFPKSFPKGRSAGGVFVGRKFELTWDKSRKRWKKIYKGRQLYFAYGKSKSDLDGYERALAEFRIRKGEIDADADSNKPHAKEYRRRIRQLRPIEEWLQEHCETAADRFELNQLRSWIATLDANLAKPIPPPMPKYKSDPVLGVIRRAVALRPEAIHWFTEQGATNSATSVGGTIGC